MAKANKGYSPQQALARLQNLCSRSEKCIYDVKLKLQKWEIQPDEIQKIIASLQESNFINERRYVEAYVKEKLTISRWGRQKIARTLSAKQLPSDIIEEVLGSINDDRYKEELLELLKKKNLSIKDESEYSRKAKLLRFAISRGYEYGLVYEILLSKNSLHK